MRKLFKNERGFSILEVMAASTILAISAYASYFVFMSQSERLIVVRSYEAAGQVESEVRSYVMRAVSAYWLRTATDSNASHRCQDQYQSAANKFKRIWMDASNNPIQTPSGITLNYISSTNITTGYTPTALPSTLLPTVALSPKYNAALTRCKSNQTFEPVNHDFSSDNGLYFCLSLTGSTTGRYNDFLKMQPVLVEFMFAPQDVVANSSINCISYRPYTLAGTPPNPPPKNKVLRNLFYSIYWDQKGIQVIKPDATRGIAEDRNIPNNRTGVFSIAGIQ